MIKFQLEAGEGVMVELQQDLESINGITKRRIKNTFQDFQCFHLTHHQNHHLVNVYKEGH